LEKAKQLILIDTNLRLESPLLNLKVRRAVLGRGLNVYSFGFQSDLLYSAFNLGVKTSSLIQFFEGRHPLSRLVMGSAVQSLLFYSTLAVRLGKKSLLYSFLQIMKRAGNPFYLSSHYLMHSISTFSILDVVGKTSAVVGATSKKGILWCMGEDEICFDEQNYDTVIYAGHHGDRNALRASYLLPTFAPFEKSNHFVNILGMNRDSSFVVNGPHLALSEEFFLCTFRSYLNALVFSQFNLIRELNFTDSSMVQLGFLSEKKEPGFQPFLNEEAVLILPVSLNNTLSVDNLLSYYADNSIVRASHVMALAQSRFKRYKTNFHL
jgi:NADH-quinone oxidoreductase subunit G